MGVAYKIMLKWKSENIMKDKIWNKRICLKMWVTPINERMREVHLRLFGYGQIRAINIPIRKI